MNFFLQENLYDGKNDLMRTARPIFMKRIDLLENNPDLDTDKWNNFTIDLNKLVQLEKGNVYRILLKFKKSYTTLDCADELPDSDYGTIDWDNSNGYAYYSEYTHPTDYVWTERDDPTRNSYYTGDRFASRNIINTSLGLMAKQGANNDYLVCVSDLATASPVNNCRITLYNYQNQEISTATTDYTLQLSKSGNQYCNYRQRRLCPSPPSRQSVYPFCPKRERPSMVATV